MKQTLYKRNAQGSILEWTIEADVTNINVIHGVVNARKTIEQISTNRDKLKEAESRITEKRKQGYKALEDLYDNAPESLELELPRKEDDNERRVALYQYLDKHLPKYNTTAEGFVLPMLAKTLEDNKPFEKFGYMAGQWKINGLRCLIGAEKTIGDLFSSVKLTYTSREGTKWNLSWMDNIILPALSPRIIEMMLDEGAYLDGELYLPGYSVNDINSFVKNKDIPQHYKLQYWCYDIAIEGYTAKSRYAFMMANFDKYIALFTKKEDHLNNDKAFLVLPTNIVNNINEAITIRDKFINIGFEGLILRNPTSEYAFGKRNMSMYKFKKKEDGLFKVVDIKEDKRGLPIYVLQNDINSELFECTLNAPQDIQKNHLSIKDMLIGKEGLVEYRERSGIKQVPFHAKLIKIIL